MRVLMHEAIFKIKGVSVHPGTAKDKMINASMIAVELASMFPKNEVPEKTEKDMKDFIIYALLLENYFEEQNLNIF